jgi:formate dehydrogenase
MAKIPCVLFLAPITGYPPAHARDDIPIIMAWPNGQSVPSPRGAPGFGPGEPVGNHLPSH